MNRPIKVNEIQLQRKFCLYVKKTANFYINLQSYKRQLATIINTIDYTLPFSALDVEKRGTISEKNLQLFLIQHKYFVKPIDINRYFHKYVHGKDSLCYEDIVECLVPHSDYILMSTASKMITESLLQKQQSKYLCKRAQNEIIKQLVAMIINTEISYIKSSFDMMEEITGSSLKIGALLWRCLDRDHVNCVTYEQMENMSKEYGVGVRDQEWKAFVNWHFRSQKKFLRRDDFMAIFDIHIKNKRNGADCNYENFVQSQIFRKSGQAQRKKLEKTSQIAGNRLQVLHRSVSQTLPNPQQQLINAEQMEIPKKLLSSKLGYKTPKNLIKMSEIL